MRPAGAAAALACAALLVLPPRGLDAQPAPVTRVRDSVYVRDAGPGRSGRILRLVLAGRPVVLRPDSIVHLRSDTTFGGSVVVLGGDATVNGMVRGDVVVVGGDVWLHPGGHVEGRVIAIGGCAYNSTLAVVRGERLCFRDHTFDVVREEGGRVALDYRAIETYRPPLVTLPLLVGLREPAYDRVNGVSVPVGPLVSIDTGRIEIDAVVTYRSHLGDFDPALRARGRIGRRTSFAASAERGTFTNEEWIRGPRINSVTSLFSGQDLRNYYRADRGYAEVARRWEGVTAVVEPYIGALVERAWSVGLDTARAALPDPSIPWSLAGRRDSEEGMPRPNPRVARGRISSVVAGARAEWEAEGLEATLSSQVEAPFEAPGDARFVQLTFDGDLRFPTFRNHILRFSVHVVATPGDTAPPQRFSYLGGSGTLPTRELLEMGGDHLFHLDSRYIIPLDRVVIRFLGSPTVMIRYLAGSAGVQRLPAFVQNVGIRGTLSLFRVEGMLDPATGDTNLSIGLSFSR